MVGAVVPTIGHGLYPCHIICTIYPIHLRLQSDDIHKCIILYVVYKYVQNYMGMCD